MESDLNPNTKMTALVDDHVKVSPSPDECPTTPTLVRQPTTIESDPTTSLANDHLNAPPPVPHKYSYPGFQYGSMKSYRPFEAIPEVCALAELLECSSTEILIGTKYRADDCDK